MDKEQLLMYLKDIQKLSTYPIIYQDPVSHNLCLIKSGGTKQDVYHHMVLIRKRINFILDYFLKEEADNG